MLQVSSWIQTEFQVQRELHAAGADVPAALSQIGNAILMGWVGDDTNPAPRLSDVVLDPDEAPALFERLLHNIALFLANHRIHGDLSAYNILYWQGAITVIDFAQMVDPRYNPDVYPLLERDIERVCSYFARYGIVADPAAHAADLWARYLMGDLEVAS
jgi:RIO kinase 1